MDSLIEHLTANNPPPDKAINNFEWAAHMQMLHHTAGEIVLSELIYSQMQKMYNERLLRLLANLRIIQSWIILKL